MGYFVSGLYAYGNEKVERYGVEGGMIFSAPDSPQSLYLSLLILYPRRFDGHGFGGGTIGYRLHLPGRISPFLGVGGLAAYGWISEEKDGELEGDEDLYVSLNPEAGITFWPTKWFNLTAYGRYYLTTLGRHRDLWTCGLALGF